MIGTVLEDVRWVANAYVQKWGPDAAQHAMDRHGLVAPTGDELLTLVGPPDEVTHAPENLLLTAGITRMLNLLIGAGGQAYTNTWARIGVGNGGGTATIDKTDLTAFAGSTNRYFQPMDSTYPQVAGNVATFKATFGTSDGNFTWSEWGIDNGGAGSSTAGTTVGAPLLNLKTGVALGTKASGSTWAFTVTISLS